jgi:Ran GTPase-activating protein (RanGAP) involved in mRNA processing and transport/predicted GTPase
MKTKLDKVINGISNNTLTKLDLGKSHIGDEGVKAVAAALARNNSLAHLDLWRNNIGAAGAKAVTAALARNNTLTLLNLERNNIGAEGAKAVAAALEKNTLTQLNLSVNEIGEGGAKALAAALEHNNSLTQLNLWENNIGAEGTKAFAAALASNNTLTRLNLDRNNIGDEGAKAIAAALEHNNSLARLDLWRNNIGAEGATAIAAALACNNSLAHLDLERNNIGDEGAKAVAAALARNNSLTQLNLNNNGIGTEGAKAITAALEKNNTLTQLNLIGNQIGAEGAKAFATALEHNNSLTQLDFRGVFSFGYDPNNIGTEGAKAITAALEKNRQIKQHIDAAKKYMENSQHAEALECYNKALTVKPENENILKQITELKLTQESEHEKPVSSVVDKKVAQPEAFELKNVNNSQKIQQTKFTKENILSKAKFFLEASGLGQRAVNHDQTIYLVSQLIRDGNDHLQEHNNKGVLLLGETGAGKSTLANLFSGRKLRAIQDDETGDMVMDIMHHDPKENAYISHKMVSETKIPNRVASKIPNKLSIKNVVIWDCPGFNDTDPVQEIANSFYIKRLFETNKFLKFVLVIPEYTLSNNRGMHFLEVISSFIKTFHDVESIKDNISLIVTKVPVNKKVQHIKNSIDKIMQNNQNVTTEQKELINKLTSSSLNLFHRPINEGEVEPSNLLQKIDLIPYVKSNPGMASINVSAKALECSSHLLRAAGANFNKILQVIIEAVIIDTINCLNEHESNALWHNHATLIKNWIPESINYKIVASCDKYFPELNLLSKLYKIFHVDIIDEIPAAIAVFKEAVETIAEYIKPENIELKHQIQDYAYCLEQQYEYVKFFAGVCKTKLPMQIELQKLITSCQAAIGKNLEDKIATMNIDETKAGIDYYDEAIKYLDQYPDSPECIKLKSICYSSLANVAKVEENNDQAIQFYIKAIETDKHLPDTYEELGKLFIAKGEYDKAIECYKVVNNGFAASSCFKEWSKLLQSPSTDLMLKQAQYFESIGMFDKATKFYHNVFSLSQDSDIKAAAWNKIGSILTNASELGQSFLDRATEKNFVNYDMVDEDFIHNLMGENTDFHDSCLS